MSHRTGWLVLAAMILGLGISTAAAAQECQEHPLIRPWPGSELKPDCKYRDFDEYEFRIKDPDTGRAEKKLVQGKYWELNYILPDAQGNWDGSHSVVEYRQNYKQAALDKGATILYENQGYLTFTLPGDDGSTTWCEVHIWNKSMQDVRIIELAGMKQSTASGPAEMKAALDAARLSPKGYGESKSVADNATEDGRAQNRRVELVKVS